MKRAIVQFAGYAPALARWPLKLAVMALIHGYRLLIAPLFPASCRYNPSCSAYGIEAVRRFGAIKGGWLAVRRVLACHPWGDHGFDPVPNRWPGAFGTRADPEARR